MDGIIKNNFGYCEYGFEKDYVHIYNLFIYPKFRNKGRAREILQAVIDEIRKIYKGAIQIVADPKEKGIDKKRLSTFYKNMGLEVYEYYG
ncbi:MAG: GNAT family N-acetyltransferase [Candidatus Aminicenantes bacterium]|nr:GNAT family N-acetyltransferase [Candidatus Aminicenantes bacterium]NIQ72214.1 GNAT family N-acetyltransferase [Candidatus Aminicenantes bacterium]NIT28250.1 GNAT family N-acetyltransferase [Candidatus Aminicenantes bacterium]